ncbi:MAG: Rne/Rng family ribonuclease, partial [Desulfobacterales bacterium]
LMPGSSSRGISRKIEDEDERSRLKDMINNLKLPEGFGIIVRTAGINCTKMRMSRDLKYLLRLWKNIKKDVAKAKPPALLYKEQNLVLRSIRDYFTPDVTEILIDDVAVYHEVKKFVKIISPKHTKIVKHYKTDRPIFTKYQLEEQIASIYESRVKLKSGGYIIVTQTEALVAIDVNSGKATQKKSIEQTALQTNIEAAEEISRQLRLRDLGGLIVIDFIDMRDPKHKLEVFRALKNNVKYDKAKTKIGKISMFGLMEMSRQRLRPSIEFSSFESCSHCGGKGLILSTEMLVLDFLRKLRLETLKDNISNVKGIVPSVVADYLLNKKRKEILDLEIRRNLSISIEGDNTLLPGMSKIICEE